MQSQQQTGPATVKSLPAPCTTTDSHFSPILPTAFKPSNCTYNNCTLTSSLNFPPTSSIPWDGLADAQPAPHFSLAPQTLQHINKHARPSNQHPHQSPTSHPNLLGLLHLPSVPQPTPMTSTSLSTTILMTLLRTNRTVSQWCITLNPLQTSLQPQIATLTMND